MNFAASMGKPQDASATPLKAVQIDGQVRVRLPATSTHDETSENAPRTQLDRAAPSPTRPETRALTVASQPQPSLPPPILARQVVMKIVKHCTEQSPSLVTGQLLGLDIGATLEVTDCFPFPSNPTNPAADEDADEDAGADYQLEMMRCLREINVDNNTVGWYQSTYLGSYYTEELIETFLAYQENIKRCVCIVYDPTRSATQGPSGSRLFA